MPTRLQHAAGGLSFDIFAKKYVKMMRSASLMLEQCEVQFLMAKACSATQYIYDAGSAAAFRLVHPPAVYKVILEAKSQQPWQYTESGQQSQFSLVLLGWPCR